MRELYNLGDLIDSNRDLHKTAVIDLGGETCRASSRLTRWITWQTVWHAACWRGLARGERVAILAANRPNISRRITASCVPGWWQCRSILNFRRR